MSKDIPKEFLPPHLRANDKGLISLAFDWRAVIALVANVGFPIIVSVWLLYTIPKVERAINDLNLTISNLSTTISNNTETLIRMNKDVSDMKSEMMILNDRWKRGDLMKWGKQEQEFLSTTEKEIEQLKEKQDQLDKNLRDLLRQGVRPK